MGELPEVGQSVGAFAVVRDDVVLDLGLDLGRETDYGPRHKVGIKR